MAEMKTMTINGEQFVLPFAPSGYVSDGLFYNTYTEWLAGLKTVYNGMPNNTKKIITIGLGAAGSIPQGSWIAELTRFYEAYGYVKFSNDAYPDGLYIRITGSWGEPEWVNPPMVLGVEYRTTERYNGAVVYAKLINFGALPGVSNKSVAHGITGKGRNVRYNLTTGDTGVFLNNYPGITQVSADSTDVSITTSEALSALNVHVGLWYTK